MRRTRIKICGITRPEDAAYAGAAGADAIGMVFYEKAKRCVTLARAKEIVAASWPFVTPVALFVDADTATIRRTVDALNVRHVQLHGHETPQQVAELRDYTVIKAIRVDRTSLMYQIEQWQSAIAGMGLSNLHAFVLETANTPQAGGTGIENDWNAINDLSRHWAVDHAMRPLIAAGGLHPDNVAGVVRLLRPYAVDVSSGVEEKYGEKSTDKVAAFVDAVRSEDAS